MPETNGVTNGTNGHTPARSSWGLRTFWALASRMGLANRLGVQFDGRRKLHEILGYKRVLYYQDFKAAFLRQDIAQRLVKAYPEATWASPPTVTEDDDDQHETEFEQTWQAIADRLGIYATLARTDMLANLGRYAVIFLGLAGQGQDLSQPARPVRGSDELLYLEPYSEEWAIITQLDGNPNNVTFGKPLYYTINFGRSSTNQNGIQAALPIGSARVHASRLLHIAADDLLDDAIYGIPWLEPIFDRLDDLFKVVGGAAEGFWRDAKRRIALEVRDDYTLSPDAAKGLTEEVEEYMHDLKDFIRVQGVDVKSLGGTVADPYPHFRMIIDLICATRGIPKGLILGSERGAQVSTQQDERLFKERVSARQTTIAEPRYLRALMDQLITLRALPTPKDGYKVQWANLLALSPEQQATVAKDFSTAISVYAGPGMGATVVPPQEFRERFLDLPPESDYVLPEMLPTDEGVRGEPAADETPTEETPPARTEGATA